MVAVNIREFTHNFSKYLKEVKTGKRITVMERNRPVAEIIPHNDNVIHPGWRRTIRKLKLRGEDFSKTIIKNRRDEKN